MLRPRHEQPLLIAASFLVVAVATGSAIAAEASEVDASSAATCARVDPLRSWGGPAADPRDRRDVPRAVRLARLAAEGRRPARLSWRPRDDGGPEAETPRRFEWLSLDVGGKPTLLPLSVPDPERWHRVMESLLAASNCACAAWGVNPGRVPDGDVLLGPVLRAKKNASRPGDLDLSWGTSCSDAATDYSVHEGTIGSWYSHRALACSTGGVPSATVTPGPGRRYYLIVPLATDAEGSYGTSSAGAERPRSTSACRAVSVAQRCP